MTSERIDGAHCARCGVTAGDVTPLTWTSSSEAGERRWYCDRCSREHLRSIEGRLDERWWA